jgi:hypothetical protein
MLVRRTTLDHAGVGARATRRHAGEKHFNVSGKQFTAAL